MTSNPYSALTFLPRDGARCLEFRIQAKKWRSSFFNLLLSSIRRLYSSHVFLHYHLTHLSPVHILRLIFKFLSSTSEAISIKYFELKLIFKFSELKLALIFSFPSPELALFTERCTLSLFISNLTPSFLSSETLATLSIEFIKSFEDTTRVLSF